MKKNEAPVATNKVVFNTYEGVDVTKRIKEGETVPFTDRQEAEKHATQTRSYVYDLYCYSVVDGKHTKPEFYGFAVPK